MVCISKIYRLKLIVAHLDYPPRAHPSQLLNPDLTVLSSLSHSFEFWFPKNLELYTCVSSSLVEEVVRRLDHCDQTHPPPTQAHPAA